MHWTPLALSTPIRTYVFGGTRIADRFGRDDLGRERLAETWEVSDVDGSMGEIVDGPFAGRSLRDVTLAHPDEIVGPGWRGPHFPILAKFLDASKLLPVHLHADDETARRLEAAPHGKTEAWHILDAAPGASALIGTKPGVDAAMLREALLRQDFDSVMRRLPIRAGETIYVPGGTLHTFGPDTLIYEIQQTADIGQHAMTWRLDGSTIPPDERAQNIDRLIAQWRPEPRPLPRLPLQFAVGPDADRAICCAGPYFALERWRVGAGAQLTHHFDSALILSNVGATMTLHAGATRQLATGRTLLLPAAIGEVVVEGMADLLVGYLPKLDRDIREPLRRAGFGEAAIAGLGEMGSA